jgi:hypothetical protein
LCDRGLQREIEEGLNVVEAWNGANAVICYGRGGDISTNRREEVEMTALCLRILQAALVYVNTLMLQDVLADETWSELLGEADRRGLTPLFWQHLRPYGSASTWTPASTSLRHEPLGLYQNNGTAGIRSARVRRGMCRSADPW